MLSSSEREGCAASREVAAVQSIQKGSVRSGDQLGLLEGLLAREKTKSQLLVVDRHSAKLESSSLSLSPSHPPCLLLALNSSEARSLPPDILYVIFAPILSDTTQQLRCFIFRRSSALY